MSTYYGFKESNRDGQPAWFHTKAAAEAFSRACGGLGEVQETGLCHEKDLMDTSERPWSGAVADDSVKAKPAVAGPGVHAIAWNTGAPYTVNGQRIAAANVDGGVWFVDVDRGISGWMPACPLDKDAVMMLYHRNEYRSVPPPVYDLNVRQFRTSDYQDGTVTRVIGLYAAFRAALEKMANALPAYGEKAAEGPEEDCNP